MGIIKTVLFFGFVTLMLLLAGSEDITGGSLEDDVSLCACGTQGARVALGASQRGAGPGFRQS
jgi:hypothetical protein